MKPLIKVCGLTRPDQAMLAHELGADYLGFIFFERSPRHLSLDAWRALGASLPGGVPRVGVFVNPDDDTIASVLDQGPLDWIQLHGTEPVGRTEAVRTRFGRPVMKALQVKQADDLTPAADYASVADRLLFDAKPPDDPTMLPGGNGLSFDWRILEGANLPPDWALAGGLDPQNVRQAVELTGAAMVDVSSGVEQAPGLKDEAKLRRFFEACRTPGG